MNNFRRKNDEIASSACLRPAASPSKILHAGMPRAIWRYMLWSSGWAQIPTKLTTNARKIHGKCFQNQPNRSHYKHSLTKLALEAHWTSNLSEFPLRIAFAR